MTTNLLAQLTFEDEVAAHTQRLVVQAAGVRLPELFGAGRRGLAHRTERCGVTTVAVLTRDLRPPELLDILRFRLAQYLMARFVDPEVIFAAGREYEPPEQVTGDDLHILAGSAATGEILCYATLRAVEDVPPGATLLTADRPLLPVEKTFGQGVYNGLRVLPDLPLTKLREMGRFVKNQQLRCPELGVRAPIEVGAAIFRMLLGTLRSDVLALVGDLEEDVAKHNLDYFHAPTLIVRDAAAHAMEDAYLFRHFRERECRPFAILTRDLDASISRLDLVEQALSLPGRHAMLPLYRLKRDTCCTNSALAA